MNETSNIYKYGYETYGHEEPALELWGEPPEYVKWIGGPDGGGFFGLSHLVDSKRGIVYGYLSTNFVKYEGKFVLICEGNPVEIETLSNISTYGAIDFEGLMMKLSSGQFESKICDLVPIHGTDYCYIDLLTDDNQLVCYHPVELTSHNGEIVIPMTQGGADAHIYQHPNRDITITIESLGVIEHTLKILNTMGNQPQPEQISWLMRGIGGKYYLVFNDGAYSVLPVSFE